MLALNPILFNIMHLPHVDFHLVTILKGRTAQAAVVALDLPVNSRLMPLQFVVADEGLTANRAAIPYMATVDVSVQPNDVNKAKTADLAYMRMSNVFLVHVSHNRRKVIELALAKHASH